MIYLFPLVTVALWYLGSRAQITSWLWTRYPPKFATFMDCSACAGFWWGVIGFVCFRGVYAEFELSLLYAPFLGLASMVWTPLIAFLHDQAILRLGTIDTNDGPPSQ